MNILVKLPTRSRPAQFLETLSKYIELANDNSKIGYCISYDMDDESMLPEVIQKAVEMGAGCFGGYSASKIDACNRDIEKTTNWDILLLISDDMIPQVKGWDDIIRQKMSNHYPDTDGCLWFNDGYTEMRLNTLCCMGKKYYDRFGYIYNPEYTSLWSDNEYTEVAQSLNKIYYFPEVIIKHEHPVWKGLPQDKLYKHNESFYREDEAVYKRRKALNFA